MSQLEIQTPQPKVKAVHRYEIVDSEKTPSLAGVRYHFIGAGGVGMSGLAKVMLKNKAIVTGSDQTQSPVTDKLTELGAQIRIGHNAGNIDEQTEAVVISAAVREDNPELVQARTKGCKVYKYAQMLGILCSRYEGIAISGTHGKSTTSGWLAYCLKEAGLDPNFIIGADIIQLGSSSGTGEGRFFVAEACEYDRSFLNLKPQIGCILNIEADHLDYYRDEEEIVEAFSEFASGIRRGGVLVANGADQNVAKVISRLPLNVRCVTFGFAKTDNFSAQNVVLENNFYSFDIYHNGKLSGNAGISLPGIYNVLNALAVVAMGVSAGVNAGQILQALPGFTGMDRRVMLKDKARDITVLDDYAHHPTEIKASLEAIRQRYQPRKLWCIFQPHQYSRTRFLLKDFAESFKLADVTILPEIYFVRDSLQTKKEVNAQMLAERIRAKGSEAIFIDGFGAICEYLKENVSAGDAVVTMGAGDIWKVANEYIQWLRGNC
jgi:UDP-N-acetylmuramate--alanine ligase